MADFEQWKEYFIANRQDALITFFEPFAGSHEAARSLVEQCRDIKSDRRPLRIMNAIERLGRLSEEIAGRPLEGTALSVLFLVVSIETIYSLAEFGPAKKVEILIEFFKKFVIPQDRERLRQGIRRSMADNSGALSRGQPLSLEAIARIVNELRNLFAHEGEISAFAFADPKMGQELNVLDVKEAEGEEKVEHAYDVTLELIEFRFIVLRGCVNFLQKALYLRGPCEETL